MTPHTKSGAKLSLSRLYDALLYAKSGGAQTAIITSKGETLISDWKFIGEILNICGETGFGQRDLHTNGFLINKHREEFFSSLIDIKGRLTNITITVASLNPEINEELMGGKYDFKETMNFLSNECSLSVRLSCVMNKQAVCDIHSMKDYIKKARDYGVHSIVFRELWIPNPSNNDENAAKITNWSRDNKIGLNISVSALKKMTDEGHAHPIFTLPWGQIVYDVEGINITSATCTENFWEAEKGSIKSVVFLPDNHLYSSWEYKGSIIF